MAELSIIIPTLKDRDEIACVPYFERSDFDDYELLVQTEKGPSTARNAGIERASADKLVFLDDDSYPCAGYLEEASRALDEEAAVQGRIVHPFDDLIGTHFTDHYSHGDEPTYIDSFISCNLAVRREVFETVGGFDETFGWGHEEGELAYRVGKGFDIYYDPDLVVRHCYAESLFGLWRKKYQMGTQRPLFWDRRNVPPGEQLLRFARRVVLPSRYAGENPEHRLAEAGATLATGAGILRGFVERARHGRDPPATALDLAPRDESDAAVDGTRSGDGSGADRDADATANA